MKENESTSPEVIQVQLVDEDDKTYMVFNINSIDPKPRVNLSTENSQNDLKKVFSQLLTLLIDKELELVYQHNTNFTKQLFVEVTEEYLKDLNAELKQVRQNILDDIGD